VAARWYEVRLIGHQGKNHITVASFEQMNNQLNYEVLTRLPQDLERVWWVDLPPGT
jgi:alanine racemase